MKKKMVAAALVAVVVNGCAALGQYGESGKIIKESGQTTIKDGDSVIFNCQLLEEDGQRYFRMTRHTGGSVALGCAEEKGHYFLCEKGGDVAVSSGDVPSIRNTVSYVQGSGDRMEVSSTTGDMLNALVQLSCGQN